MKKEQTDKQKIKKENTNTKKPKKHKKGEEGNHFMVK